MLPTTPIAPCCKLRQWCSEISPNHLHAPFAQLYGMSDNLTFNPGQAGFNAGKHVIYGAVKDAPPYLIRRAQENTSVSGDMSRSINLCWLKSNAAGAVRAKSDSLQLPKNCC
ncbi:MAG: proline dehydrogenase family protein [Haliscomenobacter sp.]|nr:proline dehydrogenase family protein [Haliscomenobacter sp.]